MITVTSIYGDDGHKKAEVAKCYHEPWLTWFEVAAGLSFALIIFYFWAMQ